MHLCVFIFILLFVSVGYINHVAIIWSKVYTFLIDTVNIFKFTEVICISTKIVWETSFLHTYRGSGNIKKNHVL